MSEQQACERTTQPSLPEARSHARDTDIAIVGGGLAGAMAAVVLGRAGHRVTLIDRRAAQPPEFRVEKVAGSQVALLRRLGLLDCVAAGAKRWDEVVNIRAGQVIDRTYGEQYGLLYHDFVNTIRAQIPSSVDMIIDRVVDLQTGPQRQRVALETQGGLEARLIVLATGMADPLRHRLGIRRNVVCEKHSISFGFSIIPADGETFGFPALTSYGERLSDRIDYINFFPVGDTMRANLFTYLDHRDPWARSLRREPKETLFDVMPGLARFLGDFQVVTKVDNWIMDLHTVDNYLQHGVVLIGDAFQTSCPAAGTGVTRLLTDVDRLCTVHIPRWLATPGMDADKILQFYRDPAKRKADAHAARLAEYRRSLSIDSSIRWAFERRKSYLRRRLISWVREVQRAHRSRPMIPGAGAAAS